MLFRSWCPACVQARAADWPYKVQVDKERRYPEIHLDYALCSDFGLKGTTNEDDVIPHGALQRCWH